LKKNRIIWIILWLLSLVGISFYGGVVSYGFFYTMTFIPVFSLLYVLYVYIFFRVYQYTDGRNFVVNDAVPYSFKLINEYHIPFAAIRVKFFEPFSSINELSDLTEYELMPGSGITRETTLVCHYRGEYEIGIKELVVSDYFRLFSIKFKNKECKRVIVDPQIVKLESLGSYKMHTMDSLNKADKLDIVSREYAIGDDVRFINWTQTARTGNLMTRERIGEEGNGVAVIMDDCRYSKDPCIYLPSENKILELTIAIAMFFCGKNINVTQMHVISGKTKENHIQNNRQFEAFYKQMAAVSFDSKNNQQLMFETAAKNNEIMGCSVVFMVLPRLSAEAISMTDRLAKRNISTVIYLVSDESDQKPNVSRLDLTTIITVSPEAKLEEVIQ